MKVLLKGISSFKATNMINMKKNSKIEDFVEFKLDNLQNLVGGEIVVFSTTSGKAKDHKEVTYDDYGRPTVDGYGGGDCD